MSFLFHHKKNSSANCFLLLIAFKRDKMSPFSSAMYRRYLNGILLVSPPLSFHVYKCTRFELSVIQESSPNVMGSLEALLVQYGGQSDPEFWI